jgi:hypothetical protein
MVPQRLIQPHPKPTLKPLHQRRRTAHVTGGPKADATALGTGGRKVEQVIETGHPIHLAQGQGQLLSNAMQRRGGQVAIERLNPMEELNQRVLTPTAAGD